MITILGYGIQGKAIVKYFLNHTNFTINTYDLEDRDTLDPVRHKHYRLNVLNSTHYKNNDKLVINCLPTEFSEKIARICVTHKKHYIDLGGSDEHRKQIEKLSFEAKEKGIALVSDCGIAPGLISSLASFLYGLKYRNVDIFCGGLPAYECSLPLGYVLAFSSQGVIKEYNGTSVHRENYEIKKFPALSLKKLVHVPKHGVMEARNTTGGLSSTPELYNFKTLNYWTLRYSGHWDFVKEHILSQKEPEKVLEEITDKLDCNHPDCIIMGYNAPFPNFNKHIDKQWWKWDYDEINDIGAMAQITGYTVASVACMILESEKLECKLNGYIHMHDISFEKLKEKICLESNQFKEIRHDEKS